MLHLKKILIQYAMIAEAMEKEEIDNDEEMAKNMDKLINEIDE